MIATGFSYWRAFFDPSNPSHSRARSDLALLDREKVVLSEFVIAEVVAYLLSLGKNAQKDWFLDYALNTANVRVFLFGKEEFTELARISAVKGIPLGPASLEYLRTKLNCDVTGY